MDLKRRRFGVDAILIVACDDRERERITRRLLWRQSPGLLVFGVPIFAAKVPLPDAALSFL